MNNSVVKTFSKRQTTVESSTYGSELVAARLATDQAVELIYTHLQEYTALTGPSYPHAHDDNNSNVAKRLHANPTTLSWQQFYFTTHNSSLSLV